MTSTTHSSPPGAHAPDTDRAGPAMPENLARLLHVVRILLEFGRHIAATIERRAAGDGFRLFAAVFGTTKLPVMRAYLHRGILRATALESLLLERGATGRDVAAPLRTHAAPGTAATGDPCDEPFPTQIERLTAERAQHDAPADPNHLATAETIEAEVLARPIGRTIDDIRRDLGIVAMLCAAAFWDAMTAVIAGYPDDAAAEFLANVQPEPILPQQQPEEEPTSQQMDPLAPQMNRRPNLYPRQTRGFKIARRPAASFRRRPAQARPHCIVPVANRYPAVAPMATGPPLRTAAKRAA